MSHKLADRTGREIGKGGNAKEAAFFNVGEQAWHGLGIVVPKVLTAKEALTTAGLDYEVALADVYDHPESGHSIPGWKRTYRTDTNATLGVVGTKYHPIQNEDAFAIMDSIVGNGDAKFESAGAIGSGEIVFITAEIDPVTVAGDVINCKFVVKNTHDGSGALMLLQSPIRVVCWNTLQMALGSAKRRFSIRHTRNYDDKLAEAQKVLGFVNQYRTDFLKEAEALVQRKFSEAAYEQLVDVLLNKPNDDSSKRAHSIFDRERDKMFEKYYANDLDNVRGTKWGAYNAVVDYHDHDTLRKGDEQRRKENEFLDTIERTQFKDAALVLIKDSDGSTVRVKVKV